MLWDGPRSKQIYFLYVLGRFLVEKNELLVVMGWFQVETKINLLAVLGQSLVEKEQKKYGVEIVRS